MLQPSTSSSPFKHGEAGWRLQLWTCAVCRFALVESLDKFWQCLETSCVSHNWKLLVIQFINQFASICLDRGCHIVPECYKHTCSFSAACLTIGTVLTQMHCYRLYIYCCSCHTPYEHKSSLLSFFAPCVGLSVI